MKPTWAEDFPKLYEIYCESDKADEANYFAKFDEALEMHLARFDYEQLEEELRQLDDAAWQEFKQKALAYVTTKDSCRGYHQIFDCFNEVKGYLYLKSEGCENIHFILESSVTSPDLRACYGSSTVLLEVKTINKSKEDIDWFNAYPPQAKEAIQGLGDPLKRKIADDISKAKSQLLDYASEGVKRRIVYLVINLDTLHALDQRNFDDLAVYMQTQGDAQIEVQYCCI